MKSALLTPVTALVAGLVGLTSVMTPATAAVKFGQTEIDQSKLVLVSAPRGRTDHQLLILEQVSNKRACWSEQGNTPTVVDPLLLQFNFTGICGRSTDSNGYSIRMAGEDLGLQYSLRVMPKNGELVLVGASNKNRNAPMIEIGRTYGKVSGFSKIVLNPGWRMTKRTYGDRTVGHVYLTHDQSLQSWLANAPQSTTPTATLPPTKPAVVTPPVTPAKPVPPVTTVSKPVTIPVIPPATTTPAKPTLPVGAKPIPVPPPATTIVSKPVTSVQTPPKKPAGFVVPVIEVRQ